MQEYGRSIVWRAVAEVLVKYSDRGQIGTQDRNRHRPKKEDLALGLGVGELIEGDITHGESADRFRDGLLAALSSAPGYRRLHPWQIEDVAADVAVTIERMLDELEAETEAETGRPRAARPAWLKVLTGGRGDGNEATARGSESDAAPGVVSGQGRVEADRSDGGGLREPGTGSP